jgi:hypothetical protein
MNCVPIEWSASEVHIGCPDFFRVPGIKEIES